MKSNSSLLAIGAVLGLSAGTNCQALAQPVQPATGGANYGQVAPNPGPATSSNPWETLPRMSVDRCLAEALGTASDPRTGAPARSSVDPETGKPVCPTVSDRADHSRSSSS